MAHYSPEDAFEELKQRTSKTIQNYFPIEGRQHTLSAKKVWVEDNKGVDDIRDQKDAKVKGRSWTVPIRAELELKDNLTGKIIDRQVVNVAQLPKITRRYSYIVDGNEWQVNNVFRMKSGVYTRIRKNGELTAMWNLAKGQNFHMDFSPKNQKMSLRYGEAQIPLYPVLKTMGIDDDSIERSWGKDIFSANKAGTDEVALRKFYRAIRGSNPETLDEAKKFILDEFDKSVLRPDSTQLTLGKPYDKVSGSALLDGSHKILRVSRQEIEPDDRDSLPFKDLHSAEDLINERLEKWKTEKDVKRKIGNTLDKNTKVRDIINPDIFGKPLRRFFTSSVLSERPTQTNPISFISGNRKTTLFAPGEGGISSAHQISLEAQSINPSHLGFLDPIMTPESERIGVTLQLASQVVKEGHDIKIPVFNMKTGKRDMINPYQALKSNLAFPDQYEWKGGKPTSLKTHIKVSDPDGTVTVVKPSEVDYVLGSSKGMFDLPANLIPFLQNNQGNRTMVASRQIEQAIALKDREAPLVQTRSDKPSRTFEQGIGEFVSHVAPFDGTVEKVKKDGIIIKDKAGKRLEVQLYDDFPLNDDKSVLNSTPTVKVGDSVKAGQVVADTNFTKGGVLALGTNLRVAYMPWKGYNFEDGIVISETAARKLTSEHLFREGITAEKSLRLDKKKFLSYMAGKVSNEQAEKLDDDAIIREGQVVNKDDVLIGVLKEETISPDEQKLGLFSKGLIRPWKPREIRWTKDVPGMVTKVVKHGRDTTIYIRAETPADVGDKIVGRHGNKGIITNIMPDHEMPHDKDDKPVEVILNPTGIPCYDEETEFLTTEGWVRAPDIKAEHTYATLNPKTLTLEFQKPEEVYHVPHKGKMYRVQNQQLDVLVTPNHKQFTARRGNHLLSGPLDLDNPEVPSLFELREAKEIFGQPRRYLKAARWGGTSEFMYHVPNGTPASSGRPADGFNISAPQWAEFMGWYLSEGSTYFNQANYGYVVEISQSKEANPEKYDRIVALVEMMGVNFEQAPQGIRIKHKGLYELLRPLGGAREKYIPRSVLDMDSRHLRIFLDALLSGDGSETWDEETGHYGNQRYWTSSKLLADGVQEVCAKLGIAANVKRETRRGEGACYHLSISGSRAAPWVNWSDTTKLNQVEEWIDYDGIVHCATVPNGVLLVRRNGKAVFSGNTRINLGQVLETSAAKIAEKTGKPYVVNNFDPKVPDYTRKLKAELKEAGVSDTEDLYDPVTKRKFPNVLVGPQYILKLHHTAEKGLSVRSRDAYDSNMLPAGGGPKGGQTMDVMGLYAMLAHNARENIREMQTYKSDFNDDFWAQLQAGDSIPTPKTPFVFKKFEGYLKGMGLDTRKEGNDLILQPLTDKKVLEMSNGALPDAGRALRAKDAKEEPGGIFDQKITGGVKGKKWSHIPLPERMPNPVFEGPIAALLGLNQNSYRRVVTGEEELGGKTGPQAIIGALKAVEPNKVKKELESKLPELRTNKLNDANKRLKYLRAIEGAGLSPIEAYTMKHLPVLPPAFRPITILDSGDINYDDVNRLYNHIGQIGLKFKDFDPALPPEEKLPLQASLYDGIKAIMLTGQVHQGRHRNAIMQTISGSGGEGGQPKEGFFQDKIIGRRQDLSMRGVIIPEPSLSMDYVGLPRKAAAEIYKPFIVRRLVQMGQKPLDAQDMVRKNHPAALEALEVVLKERPIWLKRDPVLHKFGVQAFLPRLVEGKAVKIHPLSTAGYNADFDGDKMSAFVPVSAKAVKEALQALPSRNLFSPTTGLLMSKPTQESMMGLYKLTEVDKRTALRFPTAAEAARAVKDGKVGMNDLISIDDIKDDAYSEMLKSASPPVRTTVGRLMLYQSLPELVRESKLLSDTGYLLDKKNLYGLLTDVAKKSPSDFGVVSDRFKDIGNEFATGMSIGLDDFLSDHEYRDEVLLDAAKKEKEIRARTSSPQKRKEEIVKLYVSAAEKIHSETKKNADSKKNRMYDWVRSGARGSWSQYKQMTVAPMLVADSKGEPVPIPIPKSYSEGLDIGSYFASMHGARMGTIGRVQGTQAPGKMSKQLINSTMSQLIVDEDCGTPKGVVLATDNRDVLDRFTVREIDLGNKAGLDKGKISAGTLVTPDLLNRLKNNKINKIEVRSPLKCAHGKGLCAKCYGLNEDGNLHPRGSNVGVIAAQALGEPATQLAMNAFHCNHADSIVFCRHSGGLILAMTMEELFETVDSEIEHVGEEEIKHVAGWEVLDGDRWTEVVALRRHCVSRPMRMLSAGGRVTICQDNHPVAARPNLVSCSGCGYHRLKKPRPASNSRRVHCPRCGLRQAPPARMFGELGFAPPVELEPKKVFLELHGVEVRGDQALNLAFDPYVVGMFLAEGNVTFKRSYSDQAEKHPYAVCFSQLPGAVRDRLLQHLPKEWSPKVHDRDVVVNSLELGEKFHALFGRYSFNKALPPTFLHFTSEWLRHFLAGLIDGDGHIQHHRNGPDSIRIDTTSFALVQQVVFICDRLGIKSAIVATSTRSLTRHQGFKVSLTMTTEARALLSESVKVSEVVLFSPSKGPTYGCHSLKLLTLNREVLYTKKYVYDATTKTGTLVVSGIQSHNTGGVVGAKGTSATGLFNRLEQLLNVPKKLPGAATLADIDGKVGAIDKDPAGGWRVHVGDTSHYIPATRVLTVKKGDEVKMGDALSDGPKNPREMLARTNMNAVQQYLTDEIWNAYKDEGPVRRRNVETFVRAMTNLSEVSDPGAHDTLMRGDHTATSEIVAFNRNLKSSQKPVQYKPLLQGVNMLPLELQTDWLARLQHKNLKDTILDAAAEGWKSVLHSTHPIPSMAYGKEFGLGTEKEPWLY